MPQPYTYHYSGKIKKSISQFMRVFTGIQTQRGVDRDNDSINDFETVKVMYGPMDRVVADVVKQHGTFTTTALPLISANLVNIDINPEKRLSRKHIENVTYFDETANKQSAKSKLMGVPYLANMDLHIWAANEDQMFQILEQIFLMFNPRITLQTGENPHDWNYITYVELISSINEVNFPSGVQDEAIIQTLNFQFDFWLNFPMKSPNGVIEEIRANVFDETNEITFLEQYIITENS